MMLKKKGTLRSRKMLPHQVNLSKARFLIPLLVIIAVVLQSCVSTTNSLDDQTKTGFYGVEVSFFNSAFRDEVIASQEFPVSLFIVNKGHFELKVPGLDKYIGAYIKLSINPKDVEISSIGDKRFEEAAKGTAVQGIVNLHGKSKYNFEGDEEIVNVAFLRAKTPTAFAMASDKKITTLNVFACYPYQTKLETEVCIDTTLRELTTKKTCQIKPLDFGAGQGAPIAIEKIIYFPTQNPDGNAYDLHFQIYLANKGQGQAYYPTKKDREGKNIPYELFDEMLDQVTLRTSYGDVDVKFSPGKDLELKNVCSLVNSNLKEGVRVRAWIGDKELECENNGLLHLEKEKSSISSRNELIPISCTYKGLVGTVNYLAPMIIKVDYYYITHLSKQITIKVVE